MSQLHDTPVDVWLAIQYGWARACTRAYCEQCEDGTTHARAAVGPGSGSRFADHMESA